MPGSAPGWNPSIPDQHAALPKLTATCHMRERSFKGSFRESRWRAEATSCPYPSALSKKVVFETIRAAGGGQRFGCFPFLGLAVRTRVSIDRRIGAGAEFWAAAEPSGAG